MAHEIYKKVIHAVKTKKLSEPFHPKDARKAIPKMNKTTGHTFFAKHRKDNPGSQSELFVQLKDGRYKLIRPLKYGLK